MMSVVRPRGSATPLFRTGTTISRQSYMWSISASTWITYFLVEWQAHSFSLWMMVISDDDFGTYWTTS
jgi:hypothetical protein